MAINQVSNKGLTDTHPDDKDALRVLDAGQACCAKHNKLFVCCRPKKHEGIHIATDGQRIYARWEE